MLPEGRMLDFLIVGVIALIVVGPKDLPMLMRKVGQFVAKMRGMAAEFRASFDELARQSELEELRKEVEAMRINQQSVVAQFNPLSDPHTRSVMDDINHDLNASTAPAMTALPAAKAEMAESAAPKPARARSPKSPAANGAPTKATTAAAPAKKPKPTATPRSTPPAKAKGAAVKRAPTKSDAS
jgi:sec-independent protein translocase protein TatB